MKRQIILLMRKRNLITIMNINKESINQNMLRMMGKKIIIKIINNMKINNLMYKNKESHN